MTGAIRLGEELQRVVCGLDETLHGFILLKTGPFGSGFRPRGYSSARGLAAITVKERSWCIQTYPQR